MSAAPTLPDGLTLSADKAALYPQDTYFLDAWDQLGRLTGDPAGFAARHALLLLKPDAVAAHALEPSIDWLGEQGFTIVALRQLTLTRLTVRALWYFQWNIASPERQRVGDALIAAADALLLVVTADPAERLPASVLLTERKGPTDPDEREPGQLRHRLGGETYLLNMVHTPDEPADVVRELGVYAGASERARIYREALAGIDRSDVARAAAQHLTASGSPRSTALEPAARALCADVAAALGTLPGPERAAAEAALADAAADARAAAPLLRLAWELDLPLDPWAAAVTGAHLLPMKRPGTATLPAVPAATWTEHLAATEAP